MEIMGVGPLWKNYILWEFVGWAIAALSWITLWDCVYTLYRGDPHVIEEIGVVLGWDFIWWSEGLGLRLDYHSGLLFGLGEWIAIAGAVWGLESIFLTSGWG